MNSLAHWAREDLYQEILTTLGIGSHSVRLSLWIHGLPVLDRTADSNVVVIKITIRTPKIHRSDHKQIQYVYQSDPYYNIWVTPWTHKHSFLVNACRNIQVYSYILLAFTNPVFTRTYLLTKKNKDSFSYKIKLTVNTYCTTLYVKYVVGGGGYVTYVRAHPIWRRILTWNKTINWYKRPYEKLYLISYLGHV